MGSPAQHGNGIIAGINVTPLVDITLVLLIVFIVTAKMIVTPAVPLELPRASQSESVQSIFLVSILATGPLLANGQPVANDAALLQHAREVLREDAAVRAVIQADGAVPHRRVIQILDVLKRGGVVRVAFGALPPEPVAR
jgi:biopolymer transport protein TolR